jgi:ubiquinone/menaquinone biosynthesis C-methylase UbiE
MSFPREAQFDPKDVVERGYDWIAEAYLAWSSQVRLEERARYTGILLEALPAGSCVLELGCGAGEPTSRQLAERFTLTGIDLSAKQIELARTHIPGATFVQADMTQLELEAESFDGVAAFYSLTHVPRDQQEQLLLDIARWLKPGGLLVASMSSRESAGMVEQDWLGAPTYFSGFDAPTNRRIVEHAGLEVISAREETDDEFGKPVTFLWIVARKR